MADDAMPRAKRLKLLREAKSRKECGESNNGEAGSLVAEALKSASDEPTQQQQQQEEVQPTKQNEDAEMVDADTDNTDESAQNLVEKVENAQEEDAKTEDESDDELLNLAPKRANWDMERDIAPMLRKLERRTQHAIVEILRTLLYLVQCCDKLWTIYSRLYVYAGEKLAAEQQEESEEEEDDDEEEEAEDEVIDE
ncbi:unnamed protein product [Phytophthora fragariaefolia]|uniref:Unnamed protein product n=1 Tax=Phytophthora fragariaefolia TaxID=1490495 RepID=A0A9W6X041_9STRA|nr:unnamed protein product [Phytophthora fragariaefolia]